MLCLGGLGLCEEAVLAHGSKLWCGIIAREMRPDIPAQTEPVTNETKISTKSSLENE